MEFIMYTETCSKCLGVGTISHRRMLSRYIETAICNKCKGAKIMNYKTSPEERVCGREKRAVWYRKQHPPKPVRWVPPEKVPEEYNYDI